MRHELKCWPKYFDAVYDGRKTFEFRDNDRDFNVGDTLVLHRWDPNKREYTGSALERGVSFLLEGPDFGLPAGKVVLALCDVQSLGDLLSKRAAVYEDLIDLDPYQ